MKTSPRIQKGFSPLSIAGMGITPSAHRARSPPDPVFHGVVRGLEGQVEGLAGGTIAKDERDRLQLVEVLTIGHHVRDARQSIHVMLRTRDQSRAGVLCGFL